MNCWIMGLFGLVMLLGCHGKTENRANAKIIDYCRNIDYADTAVLHQDKAMAKIMHDFVVLMKSFHPDAIKEALDIFMNGIKNDEKSLQLANHYAYLLLDNPNSGLRNADHYIMYMESLLNTQGIPESIVERTKENLRKANLNRVGTIANDFRFIDRDGNEETLHNFKANHLMLIFYDPECPHCRELLKDKAANPRVNAAIESGELTVLAVYAEGKRDVWEKTKDDMPEQWTVAYDLTGILDQELYDLPAMPIAYALSKEKRVLSKDLPW